MSIGRTITERNGANHADEESAASWRAAQGQPRRPRLSVAEGAAGLGVTRQQLYKVINGQSGVTPEMALRLEKAFGGSADVWLRMQVNYDLALVRRREKEIAVRRLVPRAA